MSLSILIMLAASPVSFTVERQAWADDGKTAYLQIAGGDVNGDGVPDASLLKLTCDGGAVAAASIQPRDSGSGMPTGKRQHGVVTITKEWGPATPQFRESRPTYDVKTLKGAKTTAVDDWTQVDVSGLPPVCKRATKTRSNIQNN